MVTHKQVMKYILIGLSIVFFLAAIVPILFLSGVPILSFQEKIAMINWPIFIILLISIIITFIVYKMDKT